MDAGKHGRVISDSHAIVETRYGIRHVTLVDDAVGMAVYVRIITHRHAIAENDTATVIEKYVTVNDDVVADFHVVAEREFDMLKSLEIASASLENLWRENSAQSY